ncbi:SDR family NAD(P)-dependent oxidoreductase [Chloroflexota bacterium]
MRLANKVAIITGAGSGIGRASSIMFAKEGAKVVVADINDASGEETVATIKSSGGEAFFVHTDVSKASDAENLIKAANGKYGKIDVLFNNAGVPQTPAPLDELEESVWDSVYAVNIKSVFLMTKYAIPVMKKAESGVIINLASIAGVRPRPGSGAYATAKAAAIHLTKLAALELAPKIRVNCINPVMVDTPMVPGLLPKGVNIEEARKGITAGIPLGRLVQADEIAYAAVYLASDESAMITGTCINVDGGRGV